MIAFDTDVIVLILNGSTEYIRRAAGMPDQDHVITIVTVEELMRGRLNGIRQAESGKGNASLDVAYERFQQTFSDVQSLDLLAFSADADELVRQWKRQRVRVGTRDLRIGATCVSHGVTLITRNRRDFEQIPGLSVEFWD